MRTTTRLPEDVSSHSTDRNSTRGKTHGENRHFALEPPWWKSFRRRHSKPDRNDGSWEAPCPEGAKSGRSDRAQGSGAVTGSAGEGNIIDRGTTVDVIRAGILCDSGGASGGTERRGTQDEDVSSQGERMEAIGGHSVLTQASDVTLHDWDIRLFL